MYLKWKGLPCVLTAPCQNGAACTNNNLGGYSCTCVTGYTGVNCQYGKKKFSNPLIKILNIKTLFIKLSIHIPQDYFPMWINEIKQIIID